MSNLLKETPHALSPELFATFMTMDKRVTKRIIEFMVQEHLDIISFSKDAVPEEISPDYQPYVKISALLDYRTKADIYLTFLNEDNSINGINMVEWLINYSRKNANGTLPIVIILDESSIYDYGDESKPIDITILKNQNQADCVWTMVNLLSDRYPQRYLNVIHDLKETDESKFKNAFLRNVYHKAYIKADIDGKKKEAHGKWLSDLKEEIEALGVNPDDFLTP